MRQALFSSFVLATFTAAAVASPHFEDYPSVRFSGRTAKVHLDDAKSRHYATMLLDASRRKPNFAGHYVFASWGCGASCTMSAAIDAKTGGVTWLPFTVCCWEPSIREPLELRPNSSLLIVHGSRDEQGSGVHYYNFDGRQFVEVPEP